MCPFPRTIPASCRGDQLWMVEKYRDRKRNLHIVFIELKKVYAKSCRKSRPVAYIRAMKDMYNGVKTRLRIVGGGSKHFLVEMGLHQDKCLAPFICHCDG